MTSPAVRPPDVERLLAERAWLEALARSLVVDPATADDIAQDATVLALTRPPRASGALRGWLRRVVRNLAMNARRGAVRREARETLAAQADRGEGEAAADVVARWDVRRQVVDAVIALEEPYRTTLILRFFEGLETAEVATRLGVPADTVKTRQRRAIEMLRARLAHLDDGAGRRGLAVLLVFARPDARRGAGGATTSTAPAAASTLIGGLAMSVLAKSLAAAVVLAMIGAAWWVVREDGGTAGRTANAPPVISDVQDTHGPRAARAKRPVDASTESPDVPAVPEGLTAFADLDSDRDISGVVVDSGGKPVAGAEVTGRRIDSLRRAAAAWRGLTPPPEPVIATERTGADGSFRVRLDVGAHATLHVSAPGFAALDASYVQSGQKLRLVLFAPTALRVVVKDETGAPCAGASASLESDRREDRSSFKREGTTDAAGTVQWDGLPRRGPPKTRLSVDPGGGRTPLKFDVVLEDCDVNETVVTLSSGRVVEGRVLDADTKTGIAGAQIRLGEKHRGLTTTGPDGSFRIEKWSAVPRWDGDPDCRIVVTADGYGPGSEDAPDAGAAPLAILLRRGFEMTGTVARADGTPVAAAQVISVARETAGHGQVIVDTVGAADGRFRLGWFPHHEPTVLLVLADGCAPATVVVPLAKKPEALRDVGTIVVGPGRAIRGRVVDDAGSGVAGYMVQLVGAGDSDDEEAWSPSRRTREDGGFAFADAAMDRRRILVLKPAATGPWTRAAEAALPANAGTEPVTIVLRPPPPPPPPKAVLRTRVVDEDGRPVSGISLSLGFHGGGDAVNVVSGEGGLADAPSTGDPQYISAHLSGEAAQRYLYCFVWLHPGQSSADVVLNRGEPVSGTVVDADGKPYAGAWVEALVGSRQVGSSGTDAQGRFSFAVPPGAVVDLEARGSVAKYPPPADVGERRGVPAGTGDVTLRVVRVACDRSVDVVMVPPEGETVGKSTVLAQFHGADNRKPIRADFDDRGRAHLDGLPRAPVQLRASYRRAGDDASSTGVILRIDAETTSVRMVVPPPRVVRGRVVEASGAPSPGASIFSTAGFMGSSALCDDAGRFVLRVPGGCDVPFLVAATAMPYDRAAPRGGWNVFDDATGGELEIVLRPMPPR